MQHIFNLTPIQKVNQLVQQLGFIAISDGYYQSNTKNKRVTEININTQKHVIGEENPARAAMPVFTSSHSSGSKPHNSIEKFITENIS